MLPTRHRLTPSSTITHTMRRGRKIKSGRLIVHVVGEQDSSIAPRVAFAVGRNVGNSVVRHRVTRLLRVAIMSVIDEIASGTQIVIRALPQAATANLEQLDRDLLWALTDYISAPDLKPSQPAPQSPQPAPHIAVTDATDESAGRGILARTVWVLASPFRWLLLGLLGLYRRFISPALPPTCRYHPSCSAYAVDSLQRHGVGKGLLLGSWRLLRCHPWTAGGLDPVPPRGKWRPDIYPDGSPRLPGAVGCKGESSVISADQHAHH